jgi:hypothetical protein
MNLEDIGLEDAEQIHLAHNRNHLGAFLNLVLKVQVP